jgi:hypothetical protein
MRMFQKLISVDYLKYLGCMRDTAMLHWVQQQQWVIFCREWVHALAHAATCSSCSCTHWLYQFWPWCAVERKPAECSMHGAASTSSEQATHPVAAIVAVLARPTGNV